MRIALTLAFLAACLAIVSCAKKEYSVVGKWRITTPTPTPGGTDLTEEFKADHTFAGMMYEGTWTSAGDTVSMKITKMGGLSMEQMKQMVSNMPNGSQAQSVMENMTLKMDGSGDSMLMAGPNGNTSNAFTFNRLK